MEKRLLNDDDIGKTFKFKVVFEKDEISKSSNKPMLVLGLALETPSGKEIEKLVYVYLSSGCQWRINDFINKTDKNHVHIEYYDNMWTGWQEGTLKEARGYCTIKKDDYGFKVDNLLSNAPTDIIFEEKEASTDVLPVSTMSDDDIPF